MTHPLPDMAKTWELCAQVLPARKCWMVIATKVYEVDLDGLEHIRHCACQPLMLDGGGWWSHVTQQHWGRMFGWEELERTFAGSSTSSLSSMLQWPGNQTTDKSLVADSLEMDMNCRTLVTKVGQGLQEGLDVTNDYRQGPVVQGTQ